MGKAAFFSTLSILCLCAACGSCERLESTGGPAPNFGPAEGVPGLWLPPEGATNLADVQNAIRTFENRSADTGFPPRVWVDVEINQVINLGDVQFIVGAFEGRDYAAIQLELIGVDPADCP